MEYNGTAIAYLRVSTDRQGRSGLGLDAQREAVARYAAETRLELVDEFLEIETGKGSNALSKRPQLQAALAAAKSGKSRLVLAKLDRLARNVHFISGLIETKVDFAVADMPNADRFQLHIYAALAEQEAAMISQRTKAALAAAKARGTVLGKHGAILARMNQDEALERLEPLASRLSAMRADGLTIRAMAAQLNEEGIASPGGKSWHPTNVQRALVRLAGQSAREAA